MPAILARPVLMLLALALLAGCAGHTATLDDWQAAAGRQIAEAGNQDPNAVRAQPQPPDEDYRVFSVLGGPYPQQSTDVHGLLLGHRVIHGQPWSIFLVGVVEQRQPRDIRLAAMSGPEPTWRISEPNPEALAAYRRGRAQADAAAPPYRGWPVEDDVYTLSVEADTISVVETRSGARWELAVPEF